MLIYRKHNDCGATLIEVLVGTMISAVVLVGMLRLLIIATTLSNTSRDMSAATTAVISKFEEIRNHNFDLIATDYASGGTPGNLFTTATSAGVITLNTSTANKVEITIGYCWVDTNGRLFGEDADFDGVLDVGEDTNGNAVLDYGITTTTYISKR